MTIKIYSKSQCVQCDATFRALNNKGIDYEVIDVNDNEEALFYIMSLGYRQVPVVVTDKNHWAGFRPDMIHSLLSAA